MVTPKIGKWKTKHGTAVVSFVSHVNFASGHWTSPSSGEDLAGHWNGLRGMNGTPDLVSYLGPLTLDDVPEELRELVAPKPLTVAEVLKKDGAKVGDKYTTDERAYRVVTDYGTVTLDSLGCGVIDPRLADAIHIPGLRRVEKPKRYGEVADFVILREGWKEPGTERNARVDAPPPTSAVLWAEIPGTRRTIEVEE